MGEARFTLLLLVLRLLRLHDTTRELLCSSMAATARLLKTEDYWLSIDNWHN